jgi:hypothetical protein
VNIIKKSRKEGHLHLTKLRKSSLGSLSIPLLMTPTPEWFVISLENVSHKEIPDLLIVAKFLMSNCPHSKNLLELA